MPPAEEVTRARRAYVTARRERAQQVCGHLENFAEGAWSYHPERCSRRRPSGRRQAAAAPPPPHLREQKAAVRSFLRDTEALIVDQPRESFAGMKKETQLVAHALLKRLTTLPDFMAHVIEQCMDPAAVRAEPDPSARYARAAASWNGPRSFRSDLAVKKAILQLADRLL